MENNKPKIRVGISIGDCNGIGCEVILKVFADERMPDMCTPVVFASDKVLSAHKNHLGLKIDFYNVKNADDKFTQGKVNIVDIGVPSPDIFFGQSRTDAGLFAVKSLEAATYALSKNFVDVLITSPINKSNCHSEQFCYAGHTDYFRAKFGGDILMLMVSESLKVALITDHIPIGEVSEKLTRELMSAKLNAFIRSLELDFLINDPKIAVLGLNPHCGDGGLIGNEDKEILEPVVKTFFDRGKFVFGPFAADGFFGSSMQNRFDGIIASYHDQGMIPFKTLSFGRGVNFTAGMPLVRTSPDHGTAYDIAGKGIADESSFRHAVYTAIKVFENRKIGEGKQRL